MSSPAEQVNALVARFVAGQPGLAFWRDFMAFHETFDAGVLPDAQRDAYWAVYDLVYTARPDPAAPADTAPLASEERLRERLRHFHLQAPDAPA